MQHALSAILSLFCLLSAMPAMSAQDANLAVFFTNDNHGEIEPCG
jgi:hypothetical protein